ncbi:bacterial transcriptional activator domain-containing protein [Paenibacillus pinihumi]|uniref:bacterial transcriptional activator domain-containing protein n=1 Tax=Paenibacillus pinihumi TaxID=669462 RepID=UPI0006D0CEDB|nr:BTAD domain-containing putative transcriptional regulator [Paenibacillus pinihumi]
MEPKWPGRIGSGRGVGIYPHKLLTPQHVPEELEARILDQSAIGLRISLAESFMKDGEHQKAAEIAEQIIHESPYDEEAYRLMMKCYLLRGKNDQVRLTYNRLAGKLEEQLVKPSELTRRLYDSTAAGKPAVPAPWGMTGFFFFLAGEAGKRG